MPLLIAVIATVAVCFQNADAVLGFVWALILGAWAAALWSVLPAAAACGMLWIGYGVLKRLQIGRMTTIFTTYAVCIVAATEVLLPATPLKRWRAQRIADSVVVRNVRDQPVLSARGNPIGIRVTFDVEFPRSGPYFVSPSALSRAAAEPFWPLDFGRYVDTVIEPPPARQDDVFSVFERDVRYTVSADLLPNFLLYDERTKAPCLVEVATPHISRADFLLALSRSGSTKYRGEVHVTVPSSSRSAVAAQYVTSNSFDVEAMYQTIVKEGRRCGS